MIDGNLPKSLRDAVPVGYAIVKYNLENDRREHERLIVRREAIRDKLRSGLTSLNAGSLIALLAALNGEGVAASWIGINPDNARWIAAAFTVGLIASAASFRIAENEATYEISDSIKRIGAIERLTALHEGKPSQSELEKIADEFEAYAALPLVGHRFSSKDFWCLALSQGLWMTGIMIPLFAVLF